VAFRPATPAIPTSPSPTYALPETPCDCCLSIASSRWPRMTAEPDLWVIQIGDRELEAVSAVERCCALAAYSTAREGPLGLDLRTGPATIRRSRCGLLYRVAPPVVRTIVRWFGAYSARRAARRTWQLRLEPGPLLSPGIGVSRPTNGPLPEDRHPALRSIAVSVGGAQPDARCSSRRSFHDVASVHPSRGAPRCPTPSS
jgi:hypothetical protein